MADFDVVVDKLHGFETAEELAELFRSYGIKAIPTEARSCAISQFVEMETGILGQVVTSTRDISLMQKMYDQGLEYDETIATFEHTDAMMHFVCQFDSGAYPDLIEDGYEPSEGYYCFCSSCNPEGYYGCGCDDCRP